MTKLSVWKMACIVVALCAATAIAAPAQTFTQLVTFAGYPTEGALPGYMSLVQGTDGNFYGTTYYGGADNAGTVFKITAAGELTTLYSFRPQVSITDGSLPEAGLIQATDGNFYGTTAFGGANNAGTVFKITAAGKLTTLYSFCSQSNCTDGEYPLAGLVQGVDGNFYGTTVGGGYNSSYCDNLSCGTVFKITPEGVLTTLHSFCFERGCADGAWPHAPLIEATDGNFYGTTFGLHEGTVFKITSEGYLTALHAFHGKTDGGMPWSGLVQAGDGRLYGTTLSGGANESGTVFKITLKGELTTLYSFCSQSNCTDGTSPYAGLIQATDGNFYGTTTYGGANQAPACTSGLLVGCGTVFNITPEGTLTTLYNFCTQQNCADGELPQGGFLQATNGELYGATPRGGNPTFCNPPADDCGTVFSEAMGLAPFVAFVRSAGSVGQRFGLLGQGFTGTTSVSLNGTSASFTIKSDTLIVATVPAGATTGYVTVATPSGTLTSNVPFHVIP
jgi:uncharacterized repeat protein (TIGR03803 family)